MPTSGNPDCGDVCDAGPYNRTVRRAGGLGESGRDTKDGAFSTDFCRDLRYNSGMSRRRKIIWLAVLLALAGGIGGYYWYRQSTAVDRKVCQLVYEAAQYPDTRTERILKKMNLDSLLREKPKPRKVDIIENELLAIGNAATPGLVSLLDDANEAVRLFAAMSLAKIADPATVEPLEKARQQHPDEDPVFKESIDRIRMSPIDRKVYDLVYKAIKWSPRNSEYFTFPITKTEKYLMQAKLGLMSSEKVEQFEYVAFKKEIEQIGHAATPTLISLLDDDSHDFRAFAAEALAWVAGVKAVEPLIHTLRKDNNSYVRYCSAFSLGKLGDKRVIEPLIQALKNDKYEQVRVCASRFLGELGDKRAVEPLCLALQNDEFDYVRREAAISLGKLGDSKAIVPLKNAMKNNRIPEYVFREVILRFNVTATRPGQTDTSTASASQPD
ncbi:MAG: HEAT repeat domain-containing protein [Planctomycetes bacterium]|nr:HEAT repeat domain-containing protein [Planctomycetota bacterium]